MDKTKPKKTLQSAVEKEALEVQTTEAKKSMAKIRNSSLVSSAIIIRYMRDIEVMDTPIADNSKLAAMAISGGKNS
ncbi:hypothetical protein BH10PSE19_BH10PSE19_23090 [soil metagenome]